MFVDSLRHITTDQSTALLAVVGLALAYLTYLGRRREWRNALLRSNIPSWRVRDFDPGLVVGAYRVGTDEYLDITQDSDILDAVRSGADVVVTGRPGIGKSHAAVHALRTAFPKRWLLLPTAKAVLGLDAALLPRRDYVVLLDDLDDYIKAGEMGGAQALDDFLNHLRSRARSIQVVATLRNQSPELDLVGTNSKVLSRWQIVELSEWDEARGRLLEGLTGVGFESWDGTPLSVKQPSREMALRYRSAASAPRKLLRSISLLRAVGLHPVSQSLLQVIFESDVIGGRESSFTSAMDEVSRLGFLRRREDPVQVYDAYLDMVDDAPRPQALFGELLELLEGGDFTQEIVQFAALLLSENRPDLADRALQFALERHPKWATAHYRLGLVRSRQRLWGDAASCFETATALKPGWSTAWLRLASALEKTGQKREAALAFDRAHAVGKGRHPQAIKLAVATILREEERLEEALDGYEAVLSEDDAILEAQFWKGRLLRRLGRWKDAIEPHRRAVELSPSAAHLHFGLAEALQKTYDIPGALAACRTALRLSPGLCDAQVTLVHLLLEMGLAAEAEQAARDGVRRFPMSALLWSYLGEILLQARRLDDAEAAYRESIRLDGSRSVSWAGFASVLRVQKRRDEAVAANRKALELDENCADAAFGLGLCYSDKRKPREAIVHFRHAIALKAAFPPAHFFLGKSLAREHAWDEAVAELKEARNQRYSDRKVALELAKTYSQGGYHQDALIELRRALAAGMDGSSLATDPAFRSLSSNASFRTLVGMKP